MTIEKQSAVVKRLSVGLGVFQALIAISAFAGGYGLVFDPSGQSLGMSTAELSGTPFPDYLLPGLFLLVIIGGGHLLGSIATFLRWRYAGEYAVFIGGMLLIWIIAQVLMIGLVSFLQPLYFLFGVVEIALGIRLRKYFSS